MRALEAKDFLVQQTVEQAALENVPLSDLEKRMMYFTETGNCPEDPIALNEEFEGQYDTAEYEKKISRLIHHAYKRVSDEHGASLQTWNEAIRRLKRGDHYVLVLWGQRPGIHAPELIGMGLGVLLLLALAGPGWIMRQFSPPNPHLIQAILLAIVVACFFFPRAIGNAFGWVLDKTLFRFMDEKEKDGE
jgi:hypothetical protein